MMTKGGGEREGVIHIYIQHYIHIQTVFMQNKKRGEKILYILEIWIFFTLSSIFLY